MVRELPHGPQAVYSIGHLSIWRAYDNTWRASRLHLRSNVIQLIYINDLPSAVKSSCTDSYVDDTKIYCSFSAKNMNSCLVKMTEDLRLIAGWCCSHQLLINPSKTKLIFFGTRQLLSKVSDIRVPFLDQELTPVSSVEDLGITLDSYLNFNDHVNTLTSSLLSMLCQISRVRRLFTKPVLSTILNSLISRNLFYCFTILAGTSKQNLQNLQLVQNFAASELTDTKMVWSHLACSSRIRVALHQRSAISLWYNPSIENC